MLLLLYVFPLRLDSPKLLPDLNNLCPSYLIAESRCLQTQLMPEARPILEADSSAITNIMVLESQSKHKELLASEAAANRAGVVAGRGAMAEA